MEPNQHTPVKTDNQHELQVKTMRTPAKTATTPKNIAKYILLSHNSSSFSTVSPSIGSKSIMNPFESQLHERLHLPLISSPSLFQLSTPNKECSEEFVWSIDDISCLRPQNIHPHSAQFEETFDPVFESKAQAAIHTFFKENINVPSPQDCWLRKQKIVLKEEKAEIINSTALTAVNRMDTSCQTQLSFPPVLPNEVEEVLRKYNLINDDGPRDSTDSANNNSMMNISTLRKKLFIQHMDSPVICEDEFNADTLSLSPPPRTPDLKQSCDHDEEVIGSAKFKVNSTSIDMFGELSPIQKSSPDSEKGNISSMDISMRSNDKTPLRVFRKYPKKNLSESFCMMQDDADSEENEDSFVQTFDEEKRHLGYEKPSSKVRFGRFDSGFANDDCSNDMQF